MIGEGLTSTWYGPNGACDPTRLSYSHTARRDALTNQRGSHSNPAVWTTPWQSETQPAIGLPTPSGPRWWAKKPPTDAPSSSTATREPAQCRPAATANSGDRNG